MTQQEMLGKRKVIRHRHNQIIFTQSVFILNYIIPNQHLISFHCLNP